jgi:hypothetical protein
VRAADHCPPHHAQRHTSQAAPRQAIITPPTFDPPSPHRQHQSPPAGFHLPLNEDTPWTAEGTSIGSRYTSKGGLQSTPSTVETEFPAIVDVGVATGVGDLGGEPGKTLGSAIPGLGGKYGAGIQITFQKNISIFNPKSWINSITGGFGIGIASPITVTTPMGVPPAGPPSPGGPVNIWPSCPICTQGGGGPTGYRPPWIT